MHFLDTNELLVNVQYGFREGFGVQGAIFDTITSLQNTLDLGQTGSGLFIDLKKAFDTVDHQILLLKLKQLGLNSLALNWFSDYLKNRKQSVLINNTSSDYLDILCGVPQGSVLGPILFLIYINDMAKIPLIGKVVLFADDAAIFYNGSKIEDLQMAMQTDLDLLNSWFRLNKLTCNIDKTQSMYFSKPSVAESLMGTGLVLYGKPVQSVSAVKYLGIHLDQYLSWNIHINSLITKLRPLVYVFHKLSKCAPRTVVLNCYYALFHSHLQFLCSIWGSSTHTIIKPVISLQNAIVRTIYGLPRLTPTTELYRITPILSLPACIDLQRVLHILKLYLNISHSNINLSFFHSSRYTSSIILPNVRTTKYGTRGVQFRYIINILKVSIQLYPSYKLKKKSETKN